MATDRALASNFTFAGGDALSDFAVAHGMRLKGHTLVWYASLPTWVSELTVATDVRAAILNHIQTVVGHHAGKVKAWDVVNEAFDDGNPASYRHDILYDQLGETQTDPAQCRGQARGRTIPLLFSKAQV